MGPFDEVGALDAAQDGSLPSAEQARLLADYCPGAVFQAVGDTVQWISPSLPTVLGWSPEDVIGSPIDHLVHRDDGDALVGLRRSLSAGEPARAVLRMLAKDDTYRSVEVWAHPYVSPDGLAGSVGSFVDVSERVAEGEARAAAERQLRLISDHSFDVLYTTGEDERVTWVSASVSRILGWTPEDLIGTVFADLVHPADHAAAGRLADGVVLRLRRRDGSYRWVAATASAATGAQGATAGPVGAFVDVDELVRTRDASRKEAARELAILGTLMDPRAVLQAVRDAAGRIVDFEITEINDVLRAEEGDLVGRRIADLAPWIVNSGLIDRGVEALERNEPLLLDAFAVSPSGAEGPTRYLDVRVVRIEDGLSVIWRDVTRRVLEVDALRESEEQYRLLAENSTDVVTRLRGGVMTWVSPSITEALGWDRAEWVGRRFADFVHPDDLAGFRVDQALINTGGRAIGKARLRAKDFTYHWVEARAKAFLAADGTLDGTVGSFRVIDEEVETRRALERASRFDGLTGLANRARALEWIAAVNSHPRRKGQEIGILAGDVDGMSDINDRFGQAAGDRVLQELAARVAGRVRGGDLAARTGGDELLVVLDGVRDLADALRKAEEIRAAVAVPVVVDEHVITATVSIGVTLAELDEDLDGLITRADGALLQAKLSGRNCVVAARGLRPPASTGG